MNNVDKKFRFFVFYFFIILRTRYFPTNISQKLNNESQDRERERKRERDRLGKVSLGLVDESVKNPRQCKTQ